jgi:hypothetical protein
MNAMKITVPAVFILLSVLTVKADNEEIILAECDFETEESFAEWKTYDLDGKTLSFFFSSPKAWFWKYEDDETEENSVFAASSVFTSNTPDKITPADDWLFSIPLAVPETGSYAAAWDTRSLHDWFLDDYEVRVIEDEVLTELEEGFTEQMLLSEISNTLINRSDFILEVLQETQEWNSHEFRLDSYKGKTIRVIWRYKSADEHTLFIDNFKYKKLIDTGLDEVRSSVLGLPFAVYNLQGQLLFRSIVRSENESFDVALPAGIYIVKIGDKTILTTDIRRMRKGW